MPTGSDPSLSCPTPTPHPRYCLTLPYLVWRAALPLPLKLLLLGAVEAGWNVYPPTARASALLTACHVTLLAALMAARMDAPGAKTRKRV